MIKAVAFDPGKTTGFATGEIERTTIDGAIVGGQHIELQTVIYGPLIVQTAQAEMTHADIMNWLNNMKPDYIIYEGFHFRNKARTGLELISREFIGIINLYYEMNEGITLVEQSPGQVLNGYWSNDKLKRLNLYRKPILGVNQIHANEACKHLLYWYRFGSGSQYGKEIKPRD